MAYYNKIGLLILNEDRTKFLVCEKYSQFVTSDYIMPGGKLEEKTEIECLQNEIKEELNCKVDVKSLKYIAEYTDVAAGKSERDVSIKLYEGKIIGNPIPSTEIRAIHWINKEDQKNPRVSPIIKNKIIPDLINKRILR